MDEIVLEFSVILNVSLHKGDVVFYKRASDDKVFKIGEVLSIGGNNITVEIEETTPRPINNDFIFFAKDSEINTSGVVGHWASVKMELAGNSKKELYSVSTEAFKSS